MSFIDWSDAEGIYGLLVDFVADEYLECRKDSERRWFLADLLTQLRGLESRLPGVRMAVAIRTLTEIHESADPGFAGDTVVAHLEDCIEELERVASDE